MEAALEAAKNSRTLKMNTQVGTPVRDSAFESLQLASAKLTAYVAVYISQLRGSMFELDGPLQQEGLDSCTEVYDKLQNVLKVALLASTTFLEKYTDDASDSTTMPPPPADGLTSSLSPRRVRVGTTSSGPGSGVFQVSKRGTLRVVKNDIEDNIETGLEQGPEEKLLFRKGYPMVIAMCQSCGVSDFDKLAGALVDVFGRHQNTHMLIQQLITAEVQNPVTTSGKQTAAVMAL